MILRVSDVPNVIGFTIGVLSESLGRLRSVKRTAQVEQGRELESTYLSLDPLPTPPFPLIETEAS
jgi:hypothetical protein